MNRILSQFDHIPSQVAVTQHLENVEKPLTNRDMPTTNFDQPLREARDEFERQYFEYHLKANANNMTKLAEVSGLERTHLYRKLKQLGVNPKG